MVSCFVFAFVCSGVTSFSGWGGCHATTVNRFFLSLDGLLYGARDGVTPWFHALLLSFMVGCIPRELACCVEWLFLRGCLGEAAVMALAAGQDGVLKCLLEHPSARCVRLLLHAATT